MPQLFINESCHTYSSFTKITDNWKITTALWDKLKKNLTAVHSQNNFWIITTALWDKLKKNLTAVHSQNNFWIIKPFYHLTILSFSFYLSSSILPLPGAIYWSLFGPLLMALVHLSFMLFTKAHIYVSPCPPFRCPISVWH